MSQITIDDDQWVYDDAGTSSPIVLVHGFPLDRRLWAGVAKELKTPRRESRIDRAKPADSAQPEEESANPVAALGTSPAFRVISVDLPGFGQSKLGKGFTISSLADGLAKFGERLKLGKFVVAGLSMGGYVAEALADQHPGSLAGLVLVDTKSDADNAQQREGRDKMIALVRTAGAKAVADEMFPKMLSPATIQSSPQTVRELKAMMEAVPPRTIQTALAAMRDRREYTSLLPKLKMPLQIIVGQDDVIAPPAIAEAMHAAAAGSRLAVISDAGHLAPLEQPKLVADALRAYLE